MHACVQAASYVVYAVDIKLMSDEDDHMAFIERYGSRGSGGQRKYFMVWPQVVNKLAEVTGLDTQAFESRLKNRLQYFNERPNADVLKAGPALEALKDMGFVPRNMTRCKLVSHVLVANLLSDMLLNGQHDGAVGQWLRLACNTFRGLRVSDIAMAAAQRDTASPSLAAVAATRSAAAAHAVSGALMAGAVHTQPLATCSAAIQATHYYTGGDHVNPLTGMPQPMQLTTSQARARHTYPNDQWAPFNAQITRLKDWFSGHGTLRRGKRILPSTFDKNYAQVLRCLAWYAQRYMAVPNEAVSILLLTNGAVVAGFISYLRARHMTPHEVALKVSHLRGVLDYIKLADAKTDAAKVGIMHASKMQTPFAMH